jgi:hypothetical protein
LIFETARARIFFLSMIAALLSILLLSVHAASDDSRGEAGSAIVVGGGTIEVVVLAGELSLPRRAITGWVFASACAVTDYYGRFPVSHLRVLVTPVTGRKGALHGTTDVDRGVFIKVFVGQFASEADLKNDWILTHEMVHLAFPSVRREHHWIEEGIATYVEPIARMEAGNYEARKVWSDLVEGLPKGLPQPGDQGLDHTHTWGRTYWGGALFCLLADLEIRQRTSNRYGLRDALRGIVAAGGTMETHWPLARALRAGDEAVGIPVLTELYDQMKAAPVAPDLAQLWRQLGVETRGGTVTFDGHAPLAQVRTAIASGSLPDAQKCAASSDARR